MANTNAPAISQTPPRPGVTPTTSPGVGGYNDAADPSRTNVTPGAGSAPLAAAQRPPRPPACH